MNKYLVNKKRETDYPNPIKILKGEINETNTLWYKK